MAMIVPTFFMFFGYTMALLSQSLPARARRRLVDAVELVLPSKTSGLAVRLALNGVQDAAVVNVVAPPESVTAHPRTVSQCDEIDDPVVLVDFPDVVTEYTVVEEHNEAVCVVQLPEGLEGYVILWSWPMVIFGHGGRVPLIVKPGGNWMNSGGGPGG